MYINKIKITNFRSIGADGIKINCNNGLNIILGENNSGKSSIIDAIRLVMSAGTYRKNLYVKSSDFHINRYGEQADVIHIDIFFSNLSLDQATAFYMLTNGNDIETAELHVEYSLYIDKKGRKRVQENIYGGEALNKIPKETFDNVNLLYLAALRDAENDLKPSQNSQLANILYSIAKTPEEKEKVMNVFYEANATVLDNKSIQEVEHIINNNLLNIENKELQEKVRLSMLEPTFESIAALMHLDYIRDKFLKIDSNELNGILEKLELSIEILKDIKSVKELPDNIIEVDLKKIKTEESLLLLYTILSKKIENDSINIAQNGLGYNNILHMAASLGDLQERPIDEEISILLVEEPEAHLHPQLLDLLFNFFQKANENSKIQLFITSHSPTLVSKANLDDLHIVYKHNYENKVLSLTETQLDNDEKLDLRRYLDVTKSQLFFAKRIIFVEGISESLLLKEFATLLGKPLDKYSVEIVNINGVAFEPFAKLFENKNKRSNLEIPCAILSDDDRCTELSDVYRIKKEERVYSNLNLDDILSKIKNGKISNRAKKLLEFNSDNICVKLAIKTLEYNLALYEENIPLLLEILEFEHPSIVKDIKARLQQNNDDGNENPTYEMNEKIAIRFWIAIQDCKGTFSQRLANEISKINSGKRTDLQFIVPDYIKEAIDNIIGD